MSENTQKDMGQTAQDQAVQEEIEKRAEQYAPTKKATSYPFTGLIRCSICGKKYRRKTTSSGVIWVCTTYNTHGKKACASKAIPEPTLIALAEKNAVSLYERSV